MTRSPSRQQILDGVREAMGDRPRHPHPGPFSRGGTEEHAAILASFTTVFQSAGGEVVHVAEEGQARSWLAGFVRDFASAAVGAGVPTPLAPDLPAAVPANADVGVSMARGAVAETGSLILGSEDGRRTQLLPPTHVVLVNAHTIYPTLRDALTDLQRDLPSGLGLHSGPSKSADIGQILVKGVHGPRRVIAVVMGP